MSVATAENLDIFDHLSGEVENRRREISAVYYTMSVGEAVSLYENREMTIDPAFQRLFRWSDAQKTRLVESILLGIPLPAIFVGTLDSGKWEVIDGMQRLSTILQFMGKLRDDNGDPPAPGDEQWVLAGGAKYLPALEGMTWKGMPQPLQLDFRRARLDVAIIQRGGDAQAKYDLFDRLNTGGAPPSDQEIRNCHLVKENQRFHEWLKGISSDPNFHECVAISERRTLEAYHMELASRLLIFAAIEKENLGGIGTLGSFVTDRMVGMARDVKNNPARLGPIEDAFRQTFAILSPLGDIAFKRYDSNDDKFKGAFSVSAYEAVACGIAHYILLGKATADDFPKDLVQGKIQDMWQDPEFRKRTEGRSGINAATRMPVTIPFGRKIFRP